MAVLLPQRADYFRRIKRCNGIGVHSKIQPAHVTETLDLSTPKWGRQLYVLGKNYFLKI